MTTLPSAAEWAEWIHRGMDAAVDRYGHLSADEVRALGERGRITRPVAEFLIARRAVIELREVPSSS